MSNSNIFARSLGTNTNGVEMLNFFGNSAIVSKNFDVALSNIESSMNSVSRLYLVSDFDHTLTDFSSRQCHDVVGCHSEYSEEFRDEFLRVCSMGDDIDNLETWWRISHDLIVEKSGLTEEMFIEEMRRSNIKLRRGTAELLQFCRDSRIPTMVTSAGLSNVISTTLEMHGISSQHDDHFHVDANYIEFHADGNIHRIMPERPVHSNAKRHVHLRVPHFFTGSGKQLVIDSTEEDNTTNFGFGNFAAVILGDREGDFEFPEEFVTRVDRMNRYLESYMPRMAPLTTRRHVFREHDDIHAFRLGFAPTTERAQELVDKNCCDVVFVGEDHGVEPVVKLLQHLVELRNQNNSNNSTDSQPLLVPIAELASLPVTVATAITAPTTGCIVGTAGGGSSPSDKWDQYYLAANENGTAPPWESDEPFSGLKNWITSMRNTSNSKNGDSNSDSILITGAPLSTEEVVATMPSSATIFTTAKPLLPSPPPLFPPADADSTWADTTAAASVPVRVIELGCGSSASACWLGSLGYDVTAVDISLPGLLRALKRVGSDKVTWLLADLLSPGIFTEPHEVVTDRSASSTAARINSIGTNSSGSSSLEDSVIDTGRGEEQAVAVGSSTVEERAEGRDRGQVSFLEENSYDLVFDMQCFHVLREIDENKICSVVAKLMKAQSGMAMIVAGAPDDDDDSMHTHTGPPRMSKDQVVNPFVAAGLELVSIVKSRFNPTEAYQHLGGVSTAAALSPAAWVALFKKK